MQSHTTALSHTQHTHSLYVTAPAHYHTQGWYLETILALPRIEAHS